MKNRFYWFAAVGLLVCSGCAFVVRLPAFSVPRSSDPNLFRGVFHVHSEFSHDSKASLHRIIRTAQKAGLDFVVVTDHNTMKGREAYRKMNPPKLPLLIFASEISTDAGHVIALGVKEEPPNLWDAHETTDWIRKKHGYPIVAHPLSVRKPWARWDVEKIEGIEIFSFPDVYYTEDIKELTVKAAFFPPKQFLNSVIETPRSALRLWDGELRSKRLSAFASPDAHLRWEWAGFALENYLLYFQAVTMYVRAEHLNEDSVIDSLARGQSFIAHESRGVAQSFSFLAQREGKSYGPGSTVSSQAAIVFTVAVPLDADIRLMRDGAVIKQTRGVALNYSSPEKGVWRVEVYRKNQLWIASNPIYVE
ncbi:MAG: hypothetical protein A3G87_01835 [Omnitrophica bacterium RIFCSPLOWO2_12_FULL_50_11]|nr:MAG: hypothetical protein A3G87_01835 [Omnitrophica bacterium RIFCSPLOWO2_12_FULL_50_11]